MHRLKKKESFKSLEDFGLLCLFTEEDTINQGEYKVYDDVESFDLDFSATTPTKTFGDTFFEQSPVPLSLLVARIDVTSTPPEDYPTVIETTRESIDFYAVALANYDIGASVVLSIAQKVQALQLFWLTARAKVDAESIVISTLVANDLDRTSVIAVEDTSGSNRVDAAWYGTMLTKQPGEFNWANQTLTGVSTLTSPSTELDALLNAGVNIYANVGGAYKWTREGRTCGEDITYMDQIQAMDWIRIEIEETLAASLDEHTL